MSYYCLHLSWRKYYDSVFSFSIVIGREHVGDQEHRKDYTGPTDSAHRTSHYIDLLRLNLMSIRNLKLVDRGLNMTEL